MLTNTVVVGMLMADFYTRNCPKKWGFRVRVLGLRSRVSQTPEFCKRCEANGVWEVAKTIGHASYAVALCFVCLRYHRSCQLTKAHTQWGIKATLVINLRRS